LVGTGGHGHTYPGATVPFGFVQLSPDTHLPTVPWTVEGWDACSGYHYPDTWILGFSHTHLTGTGCPDLGDLLVLPFTGSLEEDGAYQPLAAARFRSRFSHANELAQPGYYRVSLESYGILAELTATAHAAMHRYTFPASDRSHILLDLVHGLGSKSIESSINIESTTLITGDRQSAGWANGKTIYFVIECSQPFKAAHLELNGKPLGSDHPKAEGEAIRCCLDYDTTAGEQIVLRVGLSPTSLEAAKRNLKQEIPDWDFDSVRRAARTEWNDSLSRIQIESPNANVRQTFYSALYHTMTAPTLYNDADHSYRGPDQKVHSGNGFQYYSTFSIWDIYRAEMPLMTLVQPDRVNDFVQSMLAFYQESPLHALPMWPLASQETGCMIGSIPWPSFWTPMKKDSTVSAPKWRTKQCGIPP
jgi:predicted alpha-1,2-mannosidase